MCSVIEIKNANEYYIRYHGPESMQQQQQQQQQQNDDGSSPPSNAGDKTDLKFGSKSDSSGVSGGDSNTTVTRGFVEGDGTSSETGSTSGHQVQLDYL
jgi:hypothetical protein